MSIKDFIAALQVCIQDEFVAVSEIKNDTICVRFIDGQLIKIIVTEG